MPPAVDDTPRACIGNVCAPFVYNDETVCYEAYPVPPSAEFDVYLLPRWYESDEVILGEGNEYSIEDGGYRCRVRINDYEAFNASERYLKYLGEDDSLYWVRFSVLS